MHFHAILILFLLVCQPVTRPPRVRSVSVTVSGVSSTQAILSYTAPTSSACTVEVSENPSYSPLVHDVDAKLFAGANLDSRSSGIANGAARIFVAGSRLPAVASDKKIYSRA